MSGSPPADAGQPSAPSQPVPYQGNFTSGIGSDRDIDTARTMVIIGMVVQVIFVIVGIFAVIFLIGILWLVLDYVLVYRRIVEGRVDEAETPALVMGILQIFFGGIVPGIFLLIAWLKLRDSNRRRTPAYNQPPAA